MLPGEKRRGTPSCRDVSTCLWANFPSSPVRNTHTLPLFPHTLFPTHRNPTLCAPVSLDLTQSPIKRILLILLLTKHQQSLFGSIPHVLLVRSTEIDQLVDALFGLQNMKNRLTPDTRVRTVKKQIEDGDC